MREDLARSDWIADSRAFVLAWGVPIAALIVAISLSHPAKTLVWAAGLTWMGVACLINARRCGRTHCFYTGPFFLLMALAAVLHGYGVIWLGNEGWRWLGMTVGIGGGLLWCVPEHLKGKYVSMTRPS